MSATVQFLTPTAALAAPAALVPAAAVLLQSRRRARMLARLGLATPPFARRLGIAVAAAAASALLIVAAAQPVLRRSEPRSVRTDAELYVVLDTSRSMAASASPSSPTREDRAKRFAIALRSALPDIPTGVASFTDRLLPHLLPSPEIPTFEATVRQAVGIDRPPPSAHLPLATSYDMLSQLPATGAFSPRVHRRLLVLLSDGESQAYLPARVTASLHAVHASLLIVLFWSSDERVFMHGAPTGYRPTPSSMLPLAALGASSVGARVFGGRDVTAAADAARAFFGHGPTRAIGEQRNSVPLAPWITLLALLPLGLVLGRRGGGSSAQRRRPLPAARA